MSEPSPDRGPESTLDRREQEAAAEQETFQESKNLYLKGKVGKGIGKNIRRRLERECRTFLYFLLFFLAYLLVWRYSNDGLMLIEGAKKTLLYTPIPSTIKVFSGEGI